MYSLVNCTMMNIFFYKSRIYVLLAFSIFILTACGISRRDQATVVPSFTSFAVLGKGPTQDDVVPSEVGSVLSGNQGAGFTRTDLRAARRVLPDDPGWLVPASEHQICLVRLIYPLIPRVGDTTLGPVPSSRCATEGDARSGRLVETQALMTVGTRPKSTVVIGILPNGITGATIISRGGSGTLVMVINNAYYGVVLDPVSVRFITHDHGQVEHHVIPLTTFNAQNTAPQSRSESDFG